MLDKNTAGIEVNAVVTPQIPKSACVQAAAANAAWNPPSANLVQLLQFGPRGGRLTKLNAIPAANVAATQLQLFRSLDAGATRRFIKSKLMGAHNPSATAETPQTSFDYSESQPLQGGPNEILYVAVGVANAVNFEAEWADY